MNMMPATLAADAATPLPASASSAAAILAAAALLLPHLEQGRRIDAAMLREAMEAAFGASDATGAWDWKTAYEACEAATVLLLRKFARTLLRKAGSPAAALPMLEKIAGLMPTHTRRSAESQAFQQFSTPIPLGLAVTAVASITQSDRVLEPSAGTGSSPSSPRSQAVRSSSTSLPTPAPIFSPPSFQCCPSPASTPRR
ncbi:hypothetical protein SAMN04487974_11619 [Pelagibacterium luteolum]|uniref:Uncharacterized protein n=1 Tax=Pelagibacterium luteolum TaxID=440168 RepID=A0A1G7YW83_9HYPH|nr:hypothetical protein SAMN04487974_11619 [Pelagibacterium luteolum]